MDVATARAVLGVGAHDDAAAVRRAYRDRVRLLHPDRVSADLRASATRATAQLNDAWVTLNRPTAQVPTPVLSTHHARSRSQRFVPATVVRSDGLDRLVFGRLTPEAT